MTAPLTFAFSDDVPSAQLERAAAFAGEVRHIQSTSRKIFSGGNHLPPESQHAIAAAVNAAVTGKGGKVRVVRCLLERFEELCRRRKCDIDPELRVALARVLAGELAVNHAALGGSALKLIGVTVLQGAIGPDLLRELERFRDMPWVFTTAALSSSGRSACLPPQGRRHRRCACGGTGIRTLPRRDPQHHRKGSG